MTSAISNWFAREIGETAPAWRTFGGKLASALRYGENPHQSAAFYVGPESRPGVATARQLQGKELSYNNLNDTDAAFELVAEFAPEESAAAAIIKHANPCGVAVGATLLEAYEKALSCDPVSAYGGVVALNRTLDAAAARKIVEIFTEVIIAPAVDDEALAIVATKKNLRLLVAGGLPDPRAPTASVRSVAGGLLVQDRDAGVLDPATLEGRHQARADRGRTRRSRLRLAGVQARQIERDRLRARRRHRRRRRRTDVARRFRHDRRAQGRGRGARRRLAGAAHARRGRRFRRLLPLRRRARGGDRGGRDRRHPARRLDARRRRHRRRRRGRDRDGVHRDAPLPPLSGANTKKSRKAEGTGPYGNRLFLCFRDGAVDPSLLRKRRYAGRRTA